jgi:hypothetical protein
VAFGAEAVALRDGMAVPLLVVEHPAVDTTAAAVAIHTAPSTVVLVVLIVRGPSSLGVGSPGRS